MTKASSVQTGTKGGAPPQSPAKATGPATMYSPSPKKEKEGKKLTLRRLPLCRIQMLHLLVGKLHGFYDATEFLKSLSNRNDETTHFGGKVYRPFSNLTTKWVPTSMFSNLIWVIHIDKDMDRTENCFPMVNIKAHAIYGNKLHEA
jgi:hypothetical protein